MLGTGVFEEGRFKATDAAQLRRGPGEEPHLMSVGLLGVKED